MFGSILVPLDGSAFGEAALPLARALASRSGARLHMIHVYDRGTPDHLLAMTQFQYQGVSVREYTEHYHDRDREYLARAAEKAGAGLDDPPITALLDGPVVSSLESYITDSGVDLVVMSTHGRTGLSRLWLGSVTDGVLRRVAAPVLLVRPEDENEGEPATLGRVLVALDLSDQSDPVLEPAADLAASMDVPLTIVHIVPTSLVVGARSYPIPAGHRKEHRKRAEEILGRWANRLQDPPAVDVQIREHSSPALGILDVAQDFGADVIGLATHGRRGAARAALGSVTDKVLRGSSNRVLLAARPPDAAEKVPE